MWVTLCKANVKWRKTFKSKGYVNCHFFNVLKPRPSLRQHSLQKMLPDLFHLQSVCYNRHPLNDFLKAQYWFFINCYLTKIWFSLVKPIAPCSEHGYHAGAGLWNVRIERDWNFLWTCHDNAAKDHNLTADMIFTLCIDLRSAPSNGAYWELPSIYFKKKGTLEMVSF